MAELGNSTTTTRSQLSVALVEVETLLADHSTAVFALELADAQRRELLDSIRVNEAAFMVQYAKLQVVTEQVEAARRRCYVASISVVAAINTLKNSAEFKALFDGGQLQLLARASATERVQ